MQRRQYRDRDSSEEPILTRKPGILKKQDSNAGDWQKKKVRLDVTSDISDNDVSRISEPESSVEKIIGTQQYQYES